MLETDRDLFVVDKDCEMESLSKARICSKRSL